MGRVRYAPVLALQERLLDARIRGSIGDTLLLLEHEPVVTLGRGAHRENLLVSPDEIVAQGADFHETGRGGDVTFHGPGQLVAYPIFDLRPDRCDVRRYVRDLARVMIDLASKHGLSASFLEDDPKLVGVWVDESSPERWPGDPRRENGAVRPAKLGAIGVRISRWVTMHGLAYNVSTDLRGFDVMVPCGIVQYGVTSVSKLRGRATPVNDAAEQIVECFERAFAARGRLACAEETAALRSASGREAHGHAHRGSS